MIRSRSRYILSAVDSIGLVENYWMRPAVFLVSRISYLFSMVDDAAFH